MRGSLALRSPSALGASHSVAFVGKDQLVRWMWADDWDEGLLPRGAWGLLRSRGTRALDIPIVPLVRVIAGIAVVQAVSRVPDMHLNVDHNALYLGDIDTRGEGNRRDATIVLTWLKLVQEITCSTKVACAHMFGEGAMPVSVKLGL